MLEDFTVEKLGRVNLIVGKNNSGKSTVLEALRIYAGNANIELLKEIADSHDEKDFLDKDDLLPYDDLFTGRKCSEESKTEVNFNGLNELVKQKLEGIAPEQIKKTIIIGDLSGKKIHGHAIGYGKPIEENYDNFKSVLSEQTIANLQRIQKLPYYSFDFIDDKEDSFKKIPCSFIPTQFVSMEELKKNWEDNIYMTNEENIWKALKIIAPNFQQLGFYGEKPNLFVKVKLSDEPKPVPLKSLGDGMLRILQIAIKLVSAQGGFLLIDEFENGLHYSVQEKVWNLLFEMAEQLDVQVFATTHSWDCVQSFNNVAIKKENIEAMLIHMGKSARKSNYGQIIASVYDKSELQSMTQADIEVR
jgi:AAA15 family ATPase/GTPase